MVELIPFPPSVQWVRDAGGATSHALRWNGESWTAMCWHYDPERRYHVSRGARHCRLCERHLAEYDPMIRATWPLRATP